MACFGGKPYQLKRSTHTDEKLFDLLFVGSWKCFENTQLFFIQKN